MCYRTIVLITAIAFICACVTPSSRVNAQEEPLIRLSSFKIADSTGKIGLIMTETGQISQGTEVFGVIDSKGQVFDTQGKLIVKLKNDGILEDSKGEVLVKISADGSIDNGSGVLIHWLKDGTLSRGDESLGFKLLPQDSPSRRAASIVFFLYFSFAAARK